MIIKLRSEIYAINVCKFHSRSQFKHVPKIDLHDKKERKKIKARYIAIIQDVCDIVSRFLVEFVLLDL